MSHSKFSPRWYQFEGVDALWDYMSTNTGNPVLAYPTGTGKSVVIAMICQQAFGFERSTRIIKLTHRKELISQNFAKLIKLWPLAPAGIYSSGLGRKEHRNAITYAGIGSIARKAQLFGHIDLVIIDECHAVSPNEKTAYRKFITELEERNPNLRVIGLSATPYRVGQGMVTDGGLFTDVAYDLTEYTQFNRLVDEGWLCKLIPKPTNEELDLSQVAVQAGEYNQHQLQAASDKEEVTRKAVSEIITKGHDRHSWLIFASGVEHSDHVAAELCSQGVSAISIHSKLGDEARDRAIAAWKAGKYRAAVNNDIMTTGIDHPPIDLIGMLRATQSPGLWVQMLGRGTRPYDPAKPDEVDARAFPHKKENCLVLDFAGNTRRLGPINDPVIPRKRGGKGGPAPYKLCPICETYNHTRAPVCIACGEPFAETVKFVDKASSLELMASADPVIEVFEVTGISYAEHFPKDGSRPSLKVTYETGLRAFSEWVCLEHYDGVRRKAERWWNERCGDTARGIKEVPATVKEAKERVSELTVPKGVRIWLPGKGRKYPEVLGCNFISVTF